MRQIQWKVLTLNTLPEGKDWVLFALSPDDYSDLSINTAETLRWVKEAYWRLEYYREPVKIESQLDADRNTD